MMKLLKKATISKTVIFLAVFTVLAIPTVSRLIRPGLYSMQDFPYFRAVEYSKCIKSLVFPCRWASDAGLGFGEPVFNFYSHIPFLFAGGLISFGYSAISSLKFVFTFSLIGSGIGMFFLSSKVWNNKWSALLSSILYVYAPYRAVDVWVRGALPESFAFVFLPLVLLFFEQYLEKRKKVSLFWFSIAFASLILTHNLSVILFLPLISIWIIFRLLTSKKTKLLVPVIISVLISFCLTSFYLLPSVFESKLVNLQLTTLGYFDFRAHFVTVGQLFISRFWGYGGSTWGAEDGLSLSVGHLQWLLALVSLLIATYSIAKKKTKESSGYIAMLLVFVGVFYLFLTHNKSAFIWEFASSVMKYIQFPWRFIGAAVFSFSLAAGYIVTIFKKQSAVISIIVITFAILLNVNYFKEDIWHSVTDLDLQSESSWAMQSSASIGDYWPIFGPIPSEYINIPENITSTKKTPIDRQFKVVTERNGDYSLPVTYFPGWSANVNGENRMVCPDKKGLVNIVLDKGDNNVELKFHNTKVRSIGNFISFLTVICLVAFKIYTFKYEKINK